MSKKKKTDIVIEDDNNESSVSVSNPTNIQGIEILPNNNNKVVVNKTQSQSQQYHQPPFNYNDYDDEDEDDEEFGLESLANPRKVLPADSQKQQQPSPPTAATIVPPPQNNDIYDKIRPPTPSYMQSQPKFVDEDGVVHKADNEELLDDDNEELYDDDEELYDDDDDMDDEMMEEEPIRMSYEQRQRRKRHLINEFRKFARKGVNVTQLFDMSSNLEDMEIEYGAIKRQIGLQKSIQFQRRMLMACCTGLEYLNHNYNNYLSLELDGWSENVMEDIHSYDDVFEELYDKYADRVSVAPELKLLFMVGGSAFWFHLTNSMFKTAMPDLRQNPEFMRNMRRAAASAMKSMSENGMSMPPPTGQHPLFSGGGPTMPQNTRGGDNSFRRPEMQGPSEDVNNILSGVFGNGRNGNFAGGAPMPMNNNVGGASLKETMPLPSDNNNNNHDDDDSGSDFSDLDLSGTGVRNDTTKHIRVNKGNKRQRRRGRKK